MNLVRRLVLGALVSLAFFGATPALPTVHACTVEGPHQPAEGQHHGGEGHRHVYHVYYREGPRSPWMQYGGFHHRHQAEEVRRRLHFHGYESFIR